MKTLLRWLLVVAICLAVGQSIAPAKSAKPPRAAALLGMVGAVPGRNAVLMVGGYLPGRGWVDGADAKGAMHKGDELLLYMPRRGRVGSALLTDDGFSLSAWDSHGSDHESWSGLGYRARFRLARAESQVRAGERTCAVWHAPGAPEPRWLQATVLKPDNPLYRDVVLQWLRARGLSKQPEPSAVSVQQLVRADLNDDDSNEILIAFSWHEDTPGPSSGPSPQARRASGGVLMRYLPRGSAKPRTVAVLERTNFTYEVVGLCDLDRDGWGEVVVSEVGGEGETMWLCHWTGSGFARVGGYSDGE